MKKILLTGGLGYIGKYFHEVNKSSYDITVLDTNFFGNIPGSNKNIILKDIRSVNLDDLKDIEVIIHMAELSNDPLGDLNKKITKKINHDGTVRLLNLANNTQVTKFIYMSSASVYGFAENIMDELSTTNPLTEYSKAKVANENYILNNELSFETIMLRNSTAFGFSKNLRLDLVVNDLTYGGFANGKINLLSDGTPKRPLVHIHDICSVIKKVIEDNRNLDKEIFNVGSSNMNFSIKEIAETVGSILDLDEITFGQFDSDQRSYQVNFDKLNNFFPDFKIEYNLSKGIENLVKNFKHYKLNGSEKRLKKLQSLIDNDNLTNDLYWN